LTFFTLKMHFKFLRKLGLRVLMPRIWRLLLRRYKDTVAILFLLYVVYRIITFKGDPRKRTGM